MFQMLWLGTREICYSKSLNLEIENRQCSKPIFTKLKTLTEFLLNTIRHLRVVVKIPVPVCFCSVDSKDSSVIIF